MSQQLQRAGKQQRVLERCSLICSHSVTDIHCVYYCRILAGNNRRIQPRMEQQVEKITIFAGRKIVLQHNFTI